MEIQGKVISVLAAKSGSSANGEWTSQDFVIETAGQHPKKVCLNCYKKPTPKVGESVNVFFDAESREYNGNWYTTLKVWKFVVEGQQSPAAPAPTTQAPAPVGSPDLPF